MEFDKNVQIERCDEKYLLCMHGDPRPSLWRWRAPADLHREEV